METKTKRINRQRTVVYLDPAVLRDLQRTRIETDQPIGRLIEDAWKGRPRRHPRPAMTHAAG
jgi:hypothetical protein